MSLVKPSKGDDAGRTFTVLIGFYDALVELFGERSPSTIPALKCITVPTFAEARQHIGDYAGNAGPRAMIVTGFANPLDAGQGIFVWDATLATPDNDVNILQPNAIPFGKPGRWRKGTF